jgi:hypothetical protein
MKPVCYNQATQVSPGSNSIFDARHQDNFENQGTLTMTYARITLQGLVLTLTGIFSILFGFIVYSLVDAITPVNQRLVQATIAAVCCILIFVVWSMLVKRFFERLSLCSKDEIVWTYIAALVWTPIIFVPLHYTFSGYVTRFNNIFWTWVFQLPVNALALYASIKATSPHLKIGDTQ